MDVEPELKPRRRRGVRLTDLDRRKVYRIWHTGRRWEVLGAEGEADASGAPREAATGASDGVVRTVVGPEAPEAPHASRTEGPQR